MADNFELLPTVGLIGGETIQIVEGRWPDEVGSGIALGEAAFDLIEQCLRTAYPDWRDAHRYGVFELSPPARQTLVTLLRQKAVNLASARETGTSETKLLTEIADWLNSRCDGRPISVLGY
jgi:hypothetical protein